MAFGADTTTDQVLEGIDLTGKRALVTGAYAVDGETAAKLWTLTEETLGQKFDLT